MAAGDNTKTVTVRTEFVVSAKGEEVLKELDAKTSALDASLQLTIKQLGLACTAMGVYVESIQLMNTANVGFNSAAIIEKFDLIDIAVGVATLYLNEYTIAQERLLAVSIAAAASSSTVMTNRAAGDMRQLALPSAAKVESLQAAIAPLITSLRSLTTTVDHSITAFALWAEAINLVKSEMRQLVLVQEVLRAQTRAEGNTNKAAAQQLAMLTRQMQVATHTINQMNYALNRSERAMNNVHQGAARFRGSAGALHSMIATLTKALVSMIGVLIAFNLLITLPERIIGGLVEAFKKGIDLVAKFSERVIELQAILASTQTFATDPIKNFEISAHIAEGVLNQLIQRDAESIATVEELALSFQTLVSSGVGRYVKNVQEAVDLTLLLSNAIAAVTIGQDRSRQLAQETRDLMQGQLRPGSLLARLLFQNAAEAKEFLSEMSKTKEMLPELQKRLIGFVQAVTPLSMTLEGIKSSYESLFTSFAKSALGGIFASSMVYAENFRKKILALPEEFDRAAASVAASLKTLFTSVLAAFGLQLKDFSPEAILKGIEEWAPKVVAYFAMFLQYAKNIYSIFKAIFPIIWWWMDPMVKFVTLMVGFGKEITAIISGLFSKLGTIVGIIMRSTETAKVVSTAKDTIVDPIKAMMQSALSGIWDFMFSGPNRQKIKEIKEVLFGGPGIKTPLLDAGWDMLKGIVELYTVKMPQDLAALENIPDPQSVYWENYAESIRKVRGEMERLRFERQKQADLEKYGLSGRTPFDVDEAVRDLERLMRYGDVASRRLKDNVNALGDLMGAGGTKSFMDLFGGPGKAGKGILDTIRQAEVLFRGQGVSARLSFPGSNNMQVIEDIGLLKQLEAEIKSLEDISKQGDALGISYEDMLKIQQLLESGRLKLQEWKEELQQVKKAFAALFDVNAQTALDTFVNQVKEQLGQSLASILDQYNKVREYAKFKKMFPEGADSLEKSLGVSAPKISDVGKALRDAAKDVWAFVKSGEFLGKIFLSIGSAIGDMIERMFAGTTEGLNSIGKFFGQLLIMIGKVAIMWGTVAMATSLWPFNPAGIIAGLKMLAVGTAAIGLGVAMGGSNTGTAANTAGGSTASAGGSGRRGMEPIFVSSRDVMVHQGLQASIDANTAVNGALLGEVSRLSKESGDVLVTNATKKNSRQMLNALAQGASKSLNASRALGGALIGETA